VFGSLADVVRGLSLDSCLSRVASTDSGASNPADSQSQPHVRNRDTTKIPSNFQLSTADRLYLACG
jgi:hypothetical protein